MQLFGKHILNIFSEERGEDILPLLPMEKMSIFAFRPKLSNMSHLTEEQRYTIPIIDFLGSQNLLFYAVCY